jgi:hypothetical protein
MKEPNFRAALLGIIFVGCLGGVAVETAMKAETPRLVGLGCGPERETLVAVEEDDLPPPCYVVDTPQNLCGHDNATQCAEYLGDGY